MKFKIFILFLIFNLNIINTSTIGSKSSICKHQPNLEICKTTNEIPKEIDSKSTICKHNPHLPICSEDLEDLEQRYKTQDQIPITPLEINNNNNSNSNNEIIYYTIFIIFTSVLYYHGNSLLTQNKIEISQQDQELIEDFKNEIQQLQKDDNLYALEYFVDQIKQSKKQLPNTISLDEIINESNQLVQLNKESLDLSESVYNLEIDLLENGVSFSPSLDDRFRSIKNQLSQNISKIENNNNNNNSTLKLIKRHYERLKSSDSSTIFILKSANKYLQDNNSSTNLLLNQIQNQNSNEIEFNVNQDNEIDDATVYTLLNTFNNNNMNNESTEQFTSEQAKKINRRSLENVLLYTNQISQSNQIGIFLAKLFQKEKHHLENTQMAKQDMLDKKKKKEIEKQTKLDKVRLKIQEKERKSRITKWKSIFWISLYCSMTILAGFELMKVLTRHTLEIIPRFQWEEFKIPLLGSQFTYPNFDSWKTKSLIMPILFILTFKLDIFTRIPILAFGIYFSYNLNYTALPWLYVVVISNFIMYLVNWYQVTKPSSTKTLMILNIIPPLLNLVLELYLLTNTTLIKL